MRLASLAFGIIVVSGISRANSITVQFDPAQTTPSGQMGSAPTAGTASNLFSLWGVEYQFTDGDSNGCSSLGGDSLCFGDTIGASGLGLSLLTDPVLSGPLTPGVALTLYFAAATTDLDFAVAVGTSVDTSSCPVAGETYTGAMPGCPASVALYSAESSLISGGAFQWTLPNDALITEGEFSYTGPAISQAVIEFPGADSAGTVFAIDNLTYQAGSVPTAPEATSFGLFGVAALAMGLWWRLHQVRRNTTS